MPFTVLTNSDVRRLLFNLNKENVEEIQQNLAEALHSYSTGDTNSPCCSSFQPERTVIKKNGMTTLFMPASANGTVGMKIVSLEQPDAPPPKKSSSTSDSVRSSLGSLSLEQSSTMSSASSISGSSFLPPPSIASQASTAPKGSVAILDSRGNPVGILNAEELTAFRTSLAATMLLQKRKHVETITVFGAGRQAYWHIRLALIARGQEIKHINIVNRSFERAIKMIKTFQIDCQEYHPWQHVKFSALSPEFGEYGRLLKEEVRKADIIFCTTPSTEPLFPAEFLTSKEGQKKGRYLSMIGSYAPHMCEVHPDVLKAAVTLDTSHHHHPHHHQAKRSGVIIVDSLEACLKEAGEVIQAKLKPNQLVEVGELIMIKKAAHKEIEVGGEGEKGLLEWLTKGNVIYKSVGLGLMDLTVGGDLIRLAREKNIGTTIEEF